MIGLETVDVIVTHRVEMVELVPPLEEIIVDDESEPGGHVDVTAIWNE